MILLPSAARLIVAACAASLALVACGSSEEAAPPPSCVGVELLVAASDYASSVVCGAPGCEINAFTTAADLGRDPQLSLSNKRAFFLARSEDILFELDPKCGTPLKRIPIDDGTTPGLSNPHDVAVAPSDGSLFVTLYNVPRIAILYADNSTRSIELAQYDQDDGNPQAEAINIVSVGGTWKAFVTLQCLDDRGERMPSTRPSKMLRIDVTTRTVEAEIELAGRNPFNAMAEHDGALFLAEPGNFNAAAEENAGIERFDTATSTTRLLIAERDLGGSVAEIAVTNGCGVAIVAGPQQDLNPTSLVSFDPATGKVFSTASAAVLGPTSGYDLQGLAWRGNSLYVGDRRVGASGFRVHVFERDPDTCKLHETDRGFDLPQRPVALRAAL